MRKPVLAANWKMYKTAAETAAFMEAFVPLVREVTGREIILCPPFTALSVLQHYAADNISRA
ncbi:MAG TPA: triose-phosphate isomerase, partial [Firmicutes bacterium]|nr:triose-phosphate isomerase [Bacillota bacterium]